MAVVTFGSPTVISYERPFDKLSRKSQLILSELHDVCHCFVNKFDAICRCPTRSEWLMTVIPYAMRRVLKEKIAANALVPIVWNSVINYGTKAAHMHFVNIASKYVDILSSYHPFGTYYFFAQDDDAYITKHPDAITYILGFIPMHKIIDSSGNSIRVCHAETSIAEIDETDNRFSLRYLRDITKLIDVDQ